LRSVHQGQRLRHHGIERAGAQAAAHHQQTQAAAAPGKALRGRGLLQKFFPQRIAHPQCRRQGLGVGAEHTLRQPRQQLVGQAGDRVLLVQDQRNAQEGRRQTGGQADVATQAHHHGRAQAAQQCQALGAGA